MKTPLNTIPIDKGVPIPKWKCAEIRATLRVMKIGDSFAWQDAGERHQIYRLAKQSKRKIIMRKINAEGYRIWRIK